MIKRVLSGITAFMLAVSLFTVPPSVTYAAEALNAPTALNVDCTTNSCLISWTAVDGATGYNVYRSDTGGGTYSKVNDSVIGAVSFKNVGLTTNTTFDYKVTAISGNAESARSDAASGTTKLDFGSNVLVFDDTMSKEAINAAANGVFQSQETTQFGDGRYALLFKPGTYTGVNVNVGFYTQVSGLGRDPGGVHILGGVNANADWWSGNATLNFWRSAENFTVTPANGTTQWAVAQAAPMRRVHIKGGLNLFDLTPGYDAGIASGGYLADSVIDGSIVPASQQQWFSRNNQYKSWSNGVWNMVFVGDKTPPSGTFPEQPYTVVDKTPVLSEKPYLYIDDSGKYNVFVPQLETDRIGVSWLNESTPGHPVPINEFYVADPSTSDADSINTALSQGKNLLFTPGIYHLNDTLHVTKPNTIIMGLGFATLTPDNGQVAIKVDDVDGVKITGLMVVAGGVNSPSLIEIGQPGSNADHSANPTSLYDVFFGIGGFDHVTAGGEGSADAGLIINSNNVIGDHFWIWRADHGPGSGWNTNPSKNGLIVNGQDVTIYALFNEHHKEYQTLWNGNGGRLYFYQSEIPYDPPSQEEWMSHDGTVNGYASYKVADTVTSHEAWGLGFYSFFRDAAVKLNSAMEVPNTPGVKIHHLTTIWLAGVPGSEITHVINNIGASVYANSPYNTAMRQTVTEYATSTESDTLPPTAPTELTAKTVSSSQIDLIWNKSSDNHGVTGYDVYRNGTKVGSSTRLTYSDRGLEPSTTYSYTIRATDAAKNSSDDSIAATATTEAPGRLDRTGWTAESNLNNGADTGRLLDNDLTTRWSSGVTMSSPIEQAFIVDMKTPQNFNRVIMDSSNSINDYARGYQIYVSNNKTDWKSVASGVGSSPIITVNLDDQISRYIKVVQTGSSSSWWSINEFYVFNRDRNAPDTQAPTAPTGLAVTSKTNTVISLSWAASSDDVGVQSYDVYRNSAFVGNTPTPSYSDRGLSPLTTYLYTIKAKDAAGNLSASSSALSVTTDEGLKLDRTGWTASSNLSNADAPKLLDGAIGTRWSSGMAMTSDVTKPQYFIIDMKAQKDFDRITMDSSNNPNDYARGYSIFVSNDGTDWGTAISSGAGTGAIVTASFAPQHAQYIKVAQTATAGSWWSVNEFYVIQVNTAPIPDTEAPTIPADVTATPVSSNQIRLSWTASTDNVAVVSYDVYRDGSYIGLVEADDPSAALHYNDKGLTGATLYSYTVKAKDVAGNVSDASHPATATTLDEPVIPDTEAPSAPAEVSATPVSSNQIKLSWAASTDNVAVVSYDVYRSGSYIGFVEVYDNSAALHYNDKELTAATLYSYTVKAKDAAGNLSDASHPATAMTLDEAIMPDTEAPTVPTGVTALPFSSSQIELSWIASTDNIAVVSYNIYRNGSFAGHVEVKDGSTALRYSDTGLTAATLYSYTVRAKDAAGNLSDASHPATATTPSDTVITPPIVVSTPTPTPSPSPEPVGPVISTVDGSVTITAIPALDPSSGIASSSLSGKLLDQAFGKASSNADGGKFITVKLEKQISSNGYSLELPGSFLSLDGSERKINFTTAQGSILLSSRMLGDNVPKPGDTLKITIMNLDKKGLGEGLRNQIGNHPAMDIFLQLGDQRIKQLNGQVPVIVSLPYLPSDAERKNPERIIVWSIDDNGVPSPVPSGRFDSAMGNVTYKLTHFGYYAIMYSNVSFDDLSSYPWAKTAIEILAAKGVAQGTSNLAYSPGVATKRADFVQLLVRSLDLSGKSNDSFDDVSADATYADALGILKALGIVNGDGKGNFHPEQPISREEAAVLLSRALAVAKPKTLSPGSETVLGKFADTYKISAFARSSLSSLVESGLMQGSSGLINPKGQLTRAEAAVLIYRIYNLD